MSFMVNFDTPIDPRSRRIAATLTPLAYKHLTQLQERGYSVTLITRLFQNLAAAGLHDLDDISPLFEHPIGDPTERWNQQKGRPTKPFAQVATDIIEFCTAISTSIMPAKHNCDYFLC
jgi:hypothetical protein